VGTAEGPVSAPETSLTPQEAVAVHAIFAISERLRVRQVPDVGTWDKRKT